MVHGRPVLEHVGEALQIAEKKSAGGICSMIQQVVVVHGRPVLEHVGEALQIAEKKSAGGICSMIQQVVVVHQSNSKKHSSANSSAQKTGTASRILPSEGADWSSEVVLSPRRKNRLVVNVSSPECFSCPPQANRVMVFCCRNSPSCA